MNDVNFNPSFRGEFLSAKKYLKILKKEQKHTAKQIRRGLMNERYYLDRKYNKNTHEFLHDDGQETITRWQNLASKLPKGLNIKITTLSPTILPDGCKSHNYAIDYVYKGIGKREVLSSPKFTNNERKQNCNLFFQYENCFKHCLRLLEDKKPEEMIRDFVEIMRVELKDQLFKKRNLRLDKIAKRIKNFNTFIQQNLPKEEADVFVNDMNRSLDSVRKDKSLHQRGHRLLMLRERLGLM